MSASRHSRRYAVLALATAAALSVTLWSRASHAAKSPGQPSDAAASPQYYSDHVQPILAANCYRCHAGMNHRGGLRLDSPDEILKGGKQGAVIVPGHPEQSLLIQLIRHEGPADDPKPMPPRSKLSDGDIAAVTAWVQAGARMPTAAAAEEKQ
jgi:cytochrome c553